MSLFVLILLEISPCVLLPHTNLFVLWCGLVNALMWWSTEKQRHSFRFAQSAYHLSMVSHVSGTGKVEGPCWWQSHRRSTTKEIWNQISQTVYPLLRLSNCHILFLDFAKFHTSVPINVKSHRDITPTHHDHHGPEFISVSVRKFCLIWRKTKC